MAKYTGQLDFTEAVPDYQKMFSQPEPMGPLERVAGAMNAWNKGTTMGWSDEIMRATGVDPNVLQSVESRFTQENPTLAPALTFGGGLASGIAAGGPLMATQAATRSPILASGLLASGLGALSGAGESEDRGTGAATGAAFGFPLGVAGGYAGKQIGERLIPWAASGIGNLMRTAGQTADDIIRPFLEQSGTPAQLTSKLRQLGPEATLSDLGIPVAQLAQTAGSKNLGFQNKLTKVLTQRSRGAIKRLDSSVKSILGTKGKDVAGTFKEINQKRLQEATPLLDDAFSQKVPFQQMDQFVQTLDDQISMVENTPFASALKQLRRSLFKTKPEGGQVAKDSVEALHYARKSLSDKASKAWLSGEKQLYGILKEARQNMDDILMPDSYKQGIKIWSDDASSMDALKIGRKILNTDVDDITEYLATASQAEKDSFLIGATRAIKDKLGQTVEGGKVTSALNKPIIKDRLRSVFGDDQAYAQFMRDVERENVFNATKNFISGNSLTQARQEAGKIFEDITSSGVPGSKFEIVNKITDLLRTTKKGITPQVADDLTRKLTQQGLTADTLEALLKTPLRESIPQMLVESSIPTATGATLGGLTAGALAQ